jgi:hypothetical protein
MTMALLVIAVPRRSCGGLRWLWNGAALPLFEQELQ